MAKIRLTLDRRKHSQSLVNKLYPVSIRIYHKKQRIVRLPYFTSLIGWNEAEGELKKSAIANLHQDCDTINIEIFNKYKLAKDILNDLGNSVDKIDVDDLVKIIKKKWDNSIDNPIKQKFQTVVSLDEWGKVLIDRKMKANKGGTAKWYREGVNAFIKFNKDKDIRLNEISITFLTNFKIEHESLGNSNNTISSYMRAVRAIYNKAVDEDEFLPVKNPFARFKIPRTTRTKKKAIAKDLFLNIRNLPYKEESILWHAKNYVLIMFYCRGMNFVDLAQLKIDNIVADRMFYGRSKTGDPFSLKITLELNKILQHYIKGKEKGDYLFPVNYDGSSENYLKYQGLRRNVNKLLKIIAKDVGIESKFSTYSIRHTWATTAKKMGVSTEIIGEALGHSSVRTTEIYLKDFDNKVLDDVNKLVIS